MSDQNEDQSISNPLVVAFYHYALATGLVLPNDQPPEYYGTVEHQKDLFARLGLDINEWDPKNKEVTDKWKQVWFDAQATLKDAQGKPLYDGDVRLLGQLTGFSL